MKPFKIKVIKHMLSYVTNYFMYYVHANIIVSFKKMVPSQSLVQYLLKDKPIRSQTIL